MHTFMGDTPIVTLILVFKAHHYSAHLPYRCVKHTYILKGVQNTPLWVAHQWCAVALVCIAHPDFYSVAISSLTNSVAAILREKKVDPCYLENKKCSSQLLGARKKIMTSI